MDISIREASMGDCSRLLELEQHLITVERPFDSHIKSDAIYYDFEHLISDENSYLIVVESKGVIVGSGYAQIRPTKLYRIPDNQCYFGFIYLEPEQRGKAIGTRILDELKQWGLQRGLRHFQLDVYADNEGAIRAYEKVGFNKLSVTMELVV